ncbi:MAG TPA: ABC transporter permease subunit [Candidatus Polarisedimenticolia bacterium]|nr:ABC transporter permease subunit [Candidatus Polarisedimenticolia bacterium]
MFWHILKFEARYQVRQPLFWIAGALFFLLTFAAITTDAVQVGGAIGNIHRNAPFVILQMMLVMSALGTILVTAFVAGSVHRDIELQTDALFFSLPITKMDYLLGRFFGSLIAAILAFLGVALAIIVGSMMPWIEPERIGAFMAMPYLFGLAVFVIPNLLLMGAAFFSLATLTRNLLYTYVGVVAFFVCYLITGIVLDSPETAKLGALVDPFGGGAFDLVSRYWTTIEKNTLVPSFSGYVVYNRLIWVGVGAAFLLFTLARFKMTTGGAQISGRRARKAAALAVAAESAPRISTEPLPRVTPSVDGAWTQFWHQVRLEVRGSLRGIPFLFMLFFGMFNLVASSALVEERLGTSVYPVTYLMLQRTAGAFGLFMFLIIVVYAAEMVWRDRMQRVHEMVDAMPVPNWVMWSSRLMALCVLVFAVLGVTMLTNMGIQTFSGYTHYELGLYVRGLLLVLGPTFLFSAALSLFLQVVVNQRYIAWLIGAVIFIARGVLPALRLEHNLYRFGGAGETMYSDMNGYGHFVKSMFWFDLYWTFVCAALVVIAHLFWVRGTETSRALRVREARRRFTLPPKSALAFCILGAAATGSWIYYNTCVLNHYVPAKTALDRQADFEKKYKQYEKIPMPKVTAVKADVDIYPETRAADLRGHYTLRNKTVAPIDTLHVTLNPEVKTRTLTVEHGTIEMQDKEAGYTIYKLSPPLEPGADLAIDFDLGVTHSGFVNNGLQPEIVYNGTFFNSFDYFPHLGYQRNGEINDPNERRKRGLPPAERAPKLGDQEAIQHSYLSTESDWIDFETTVSTSPDQIALAPGYLQKEWTENGRRYFSYKMDAPIFNFYAYLSARYAVKKDVWHGADGKDVAIEIYYHPAHAWNVDRMINGVKKSLDYFTANFGPYQHRQMRILEFPRYAVFAQSFPNTVPYSEGIGFIARLNDKPDAIDYVFYVTAHEVAHQWWAHQVMGGDVQGATVTSETMSQYSALMVMEKEYGRDKMRKFLKYELDNYLRGRGTERLEELPLYLVENQPYIHYRKGSLVMYELKDQVGEEPLNHALAAYVKKVGFQGPPYTTTLEFLDAIQAAVPADKPALLDDLFRNITLYENKAESATWKKRDDGKYVVTLDVATAKFRADGQGKETPATLDDWIDVGVFGDKDKDTPPEGKVLSLEKHRINAATEKLEIVVDSEPRKAGIDPFNKLIDRIPDNNIVSVSAGS